jgi:antitoxin (DNA-binding transcriptional repressor) of toxin-antitoxin stability system
MEDVTLIHAKEHLEELIERARRGEAVRITDPHLGTVRLMPEGPTDQAEPPYPPRIAGQWKDRLAEIPDEQLFAPLSEEELAWLSGEKSGVE